MCVSVCVCVYAREWCVCVCLSDTLKTWSYQLHLFGGLSAIALAQGRLMAPLAQWRIYFHEKRLNRIAISVQWVV